MVARPPRRGAVRLREVRVVAEAVREDADPPDAPETLAVGVNVVVVLPGRVEQEPHAEVAAPLRGPARAVDVVAKEVDERAEAELADALPVLLRAAA